MGRYRDREAMAMTRNPSSPSLDQLHRSQLETLTKHELIDFILSKPEIFSTPANNNIWSKLSTSTTNGINLEQREHDDVVLVDSDPESPVLVSVYTQSKLTNGATREANSRHDNPVSPSCPEDELSTPEVESPGRQLTPQSPEIVLSSQQNVGSVSKTNEIERSTSSSNNTINPDFSSESSEIRHFVCSILHSVVDEATAGTSLQNNGSKESRSAINSGKESKSCNGHCGSIYSSVVRLSKDLKALQELLTVTQFLSVPYIDTCDSANRDVPQFPLSGEDIGYSTCTVYRPQTASGNHPERSPGRGRKRRNSKNRRNEPYVLGNSSRVESNHSSAKIPKPVPDDSSEATTANGVQLEMPSCEKLANVVDKVVPIVPIEKLPFDSQREETLCDTMIKQTPERQSKRNAIPVGTMFALYDEIVNYELDNSEVNKTTTTENNAVATCSSTATNNAASCLKVITSNAASYSNAKTNEVASSSSTSTNKAASCTTAKVTESAEAIKVPLSAEGNKSAKTHDLGSCSSVTTNEACGSKSSSKVHEGTSTSSGQPMDISIDIQRLTGSNWESLEDSGEFEVICVKKDEFGRKHRIMECFIDLEDFTHPAFIDRMATVEKKALERSEKRARKLKRRKKRWLKSKFKRTKKQRSSVPELDVLQTAARFQKTSGIENEAFLRRREHEVIYGVDIVQSEESCDSDFIP